MGAMGSPRVVEQDVEDASLAWLGASGFAVAHGPDIAKQRAEQPSQVERDFEASIEAVKQIEARRAPGKRGPKP
jgi:hypothetical protein